MTAHDGGTNGDQRVTNALIYERLGTMNKLLSEHIEQDRAIWTAMEARLRTLESGASVRETKLANMSEREREIDGDLGTIRNRDYVFGGISTLIASVIAAIVAAIKQP